MFTDVGLFAPIYFWGTGLHVLLIINIRLYPSIQLKKKELPSYYINFTFRNINSHFCSLVMGIQRLLHLASLCNLLILYKPP